MPYLPAFYICILFEFFSTQLKFITTLWSVDQIAQLLSKRIYDDDDDDLLKPFTADLVKALHFAILV